MQMVYNSESFVVVQFEPTPGEGPSPALGGYEIVDKTARKEIFIGGAVAQTFRRGVEALVEDGEASQETFDEFIAGFTVLAQQPVVLH